MDPKRPQDLLQGQAEMGLLPARGRPIAAHRHSLGSWAKHGPYRIQHHITAGLQEVALLLYQDGLVSALKEMSHTLMPLVEMLGVDPIELPHSEGKIPLRGLGDQVIVIVHQAVGVTEPMVPLIDLAEEIQKGDAILVVPEDRILGISARGKMVEGSLILDPQRSGHTRMLSHPGADVNSKDLTPYLSGRWAFSRMEVKVMRFSLETGFSLDIAIATLLPGMASRRDSRRALVACGPN